MEMSRYAVELKKLVETGNVEGARILLSKLIDTQNPFFYEVKRKRRIPAIGDDDPEDADVLFPAKVDKDDPLYGIQLCISPFDKEPHPQNCLLKANLRGLSRAIGWTWSESEVAEYTREILERMTHYPLLGGYYTAAVDRVCEYALERKQYEHDLSSRARLWAFRGNFRNLSTFKWRLPEKRDGGYVSVADQAAERFAKLGLSQEEILDEFRLMIGHEGGFNWQITTELARSKVFAGREAERDHVLISRFIRPNLSELLKRGREKDANALFFLEILQNAVQQTLSHAPQADQEKEGSLV